MWSQIWNQNPVEVLKLLASTATPLAIAIIGLLINRSIQRQNAIAQRQSSWLTRWANDFLKVAAGINEAAASFLMMYVSTQWEEKNVLLGTEEEKKLFQSDAVQIALALQRGRWEISKFTAFAPIWGETLEEAAQSLVHEASYWLPNEGGVIEEFREKQLAFNTNVRKVHAELLGLKD